MPTLCVPGLAAGALEVLLLLLLLFFLLCLLILACMLEGCALSFVCSMFAFCCRLRGSKVFAVFTLKEGLVPLQLGKSICLVNLLNYRIQAVLVFSKLLAMFRLNPRKHL